MVAKLLPFVGEKISAKKCPPLLLHRIHFSTLVTIVKQPEHQSAHFIFSNPNSAYGDRIQKKFGLIWANGCRDIAILMRESTSQKILLGYLMWELTVY